MNATLLPLVRVEIPGQGCVSGCTHKERRVSLRHAHVCCFIQNNPGELQVSFCFEIVRLGNWPLEDGI